jgi:uncharacterized protein YhdP
LSIPLNIEGARPDIALDFSLADNRLYIPEYKLQLEALSGQMSYTDDNGIQGEALQANVLGHPVVASIRSSGFANTDESLDTDAQSTELSWSGSADISALTAWSGLPAAVLPVLSQFEGKLAYQAGINVPAMSADSPRTRNPTLSITTEMAGVESKLPAPFSKPADQLSQLDITLEFKPQGSALDMRWQDVTQMNLEFGQDLPASGLIYLGATAEGLRVRSINPAASGIQVLGSVASADYGEWQRTLAAMYPPDPARQGSGAARSGWLSDIQGTAELALGELTVAGEVFDELTLNLRREDQAFVLAVQSQDVSGTLAYPVNGSAPWQVNLDYLHLGEAPAVPAEDVEEPPVLIAEAVSEEQLFQDLQDLPSVEFELPREDPLQALDPRTFPPMQLTVGHFTVNGGDFGQWQFTLSSDGSGAVFRDLQVAARGLMVGSERP